MIAEAGTNALATFALSGHGTLTPIGRHRQGRDLLGGSAGPFLFASNAGSADESGFTSSAGRPATPRRATGH